MKIAILGAACTGKTRLARELAQALASPDTGTTWVPEVAAAWCAAHQCLSGSEPDKLLALAQEQARQIEAATGAQYLFADTTPLMTAIHCDLLWGDPSLYAFALQHQRSYHLTLVTGLDLQCGHDDMPGNGALAPARVDARLREVLQAHALRYAVVYGYGMERLDSALQGVRQHGKTPATPALQHANWIWQCEKCSDADCEHRLFSSLVSTDSVRV